MNRQTTGPEDLDRFMGCFGSFDAENKVCIGHCALSLRCAIEKDEHMRMELLEELVSPDGMILKMQ
jgi:hypothetical protein